MAEQKKKPKPSKDKEGAEDAGQKTAQKKTEEVDELLDEIDEVLETNAEDFVRAYIQKGGELFVPLGLLTPYDWAPVIAFALFLFVRWRHASVS
jgi:prokaryotic ubiquitin-like protein Pup